VRTPPPQFGYKVKAGVEIKFLGAAATKLLIQGSPLPDRC